MTGPQTTPSLDGIDLGPEDTSLIVMLRGPGAAMRTETVAVVIHRRFGIFTHVYASLASPRRGESAVHLAHVLDGERVGEAVEWVLATLAARGALVPTGCGGGLRRRRELALADEVQSESARRFGRG